MGVPHNSFFAMGDKAGSFGFFLPTGYKFIQTEGLVANLEYIRSMLNDQGARFVTNLGVTHYIAERERYFEEGEIIGLAEPVQGFSAKFGPYLLCFEKNGLVDDSKYAQPPQRRLLISANAQVHCPKEMMDKFHKLRAQYGGLVRYSMPSEYSDGAYKYALDFNSQ